MALNSNLGILLYAGCPIEYIYLYAFNPSLNVVN